MSENPWRGAGEHVAAIASLGMMGMYYFERVLREREQRQLEAALNTWENEGGSGPSDVVFDEPPKKWLLMRMVNGNGRWNAYGWHPHGDVFRLLATCAGSTDAAVREQAQALMREWGVE